jgi:hypothetical protein
MRRTLIITAILAAAGCCVPSSALADGSSFALRPVTYTPSIPATQSYFIVAARPGQSIQSEVRVSNEGTTTGTALLYAVDATTGRTSGAVYLSRRSRRRDVGAWLRLALHRVTLAPGESRIVPFTVVVSAHVRPGQHLGGIVAENLRVTGGLARRTGKRKGSLQIRIRHLTIVAVEVTLPGRRRDKIALTNVAWARMGAYPVAVLSLRNEGTFMIKPQGTIRLTATNGAIVDRQAFVLDTFLPQTSIDYPLVLRKNLAAGTYRADVQLEYGDARTLRATRSLTVSKPKTTVRDAAPPPPATATSAAGRVASRPGTSITLPWIVACLGIALGLAGGVAALRSRRT